MKTGTQKRFFGRTLLRTNMLLTSLLLVIGMLAAMFPFTYQLTRRVLRDSQTEQSTRMLEQTRQSVEFYLESMLEASDYLTDQPEVTAYLGGDDRLGSAVRNQLRVISGTRSDLYQLVLLRTDGTWLSNRSAVRQNPYRDVTDADWYKRAAAAKGKAIFTSSRVENLFFGEYPWVITMAKAIYDGTAMLGILLIDLNYESIASILQSTRQDDNQAYFFIVGSDGRLVYHPQQQLIYSGLKTERLDQVVHADTDEQAFEADGKLYLAERSGISGWTTVSVLNTSTLVRIPDEWIVLYALVGLAFVLLASLLSWLLAKRLTRPLFSLQQSMTRFESGDLDTRADTEATREIADLGDSFNKMTTRIKELLAESVAAEEQKRQSEMLALQAQIRPHFLYNTLESIIWMSEIGENERVVEMTSALSKLLRAQIAGGAEVIRLEEEFAYTSHYLTIQTLRYGDRLHYEKRIEPGLEHAAVLRLILQPIVENAIYHGTRQSTRNGFVRIEAKSDGDHVVIEVSDNGIGFAQAEHWRSLDKRPEGGIGLRNVEDRIMLYFGPEYRLEIKSLPRTDATDESAPTTVVRIRHPRIEL